MYRYTYTYVVHIGGSELLVQIDVHYRLGRVTVADVLEPCSWSMYFRKNLPQIGTVRITDATFKKKNLKQYEGKKPFVFRGKTQNEYIY
jgi:hypothetical protein